MTEQPGGTATPDDTDTDEDAWTPFAGDEDDDPEQHIGDEVKA